MILSNKVNINTLQKKKYKSIANLPIMNIIFWRKDREKNVDYINNLKLIDLWCLRTDYSVNNTSINVD